MVVDTSTRARVPLGSLTPAPWNPRLIRDARFQNLCRSIEADPEFLEQRPILATADGTIYAGNMRYRAVQHLGWPDVPAVLSDIPEQLARERALRDNAQWGEWQEDDLAALLYGLQQEGSALDLLGFEDDEITRLLDSVGAFGEPADDPGAQVDRAAELREKWQTARGQLWEIGRHRLLCGDSTSAEDVARLMGGERAVVMWTDPPYGVSYVGKTAAAMTIENDDAPGIGTLLDDVFGVATGVLEPGSPFYVASPAGTLATEFRLAIARAGWRFHQALVWIKDTMVLGHSDYHYQHEDILYGWTQGAGRSGRGNHEGSRWYGDHAQVSVFMVDRPKRSEDHPTEKPVDLVRPMLENSSPPDAIVYEPFSGSGTTLAACEQSSRRGRALDLEPKYVAVALERLSGMGLTPRLADG